MNTKPRMHHLRPMLTGRTGRRQHMARPITVDGRTWTWVSLCGLPVELPAPASSSCEDVGAGFVVFECRQA